MPNRKYQSITTRIGAALGNIPKLLSRLTPGAGAVSALAVPIQPHIAFANPLSYDPMMSNVLAGLGIVAGITLGIVYRSMSESRETLKKKADTADAELRAVLTMTDDAVLLLDSRTTIRGANPAAEELFGKSIDDLVGEELQRLIAHPLNLPELTRSGPALFKSTTSQPGEKAKIDIVLSEVHFSKGTSFLALIRDENAAPKEVAETERVPDLSAPVGKFCHDLNNVLTGIIGNLSLILMTAPPDATTSERITGAKRSAIRAQELNRKLLALAKGEDSGLDAPFEATPAKPTIVPIPSMMKTEPAPAKAESVKSQRLDAPPTRSATEAKPRVLVLDDEEAICALIAAALGSMGYDVVEANDADQAIKACEEAAKSGQRFELVISDLSLPGELSGEEAVRRMKQIDPELKAIVSSGYDSDPVMSKFRDHGFCAAISKPYDISKLGRVVTNALKAEEEQRKTA